MNGPFSISRGPSRECHCVFRTSLCYYIPLFALHVFLSSDWLSWRSRSFSRYPWIPLIHPSFKTLHVCRHLPSRNLTPWGCELSRIPWDGEITIKPRASATKEGFAESCTSVLILCYLSGSKTCEVRDLKTWTVFTVSVRSWDVNCPGEPNIGR